MLLELGKAHMRERLAEAEQERRYLEAARARQQAAPRRMSRLVGDFGRWVVHHIAG